MTAISARPTRRLATATSWRRGVGSTWRRGSGRALSAWRRGWPRPRRPIRRSGRARSLTTLAAYARERGITLLTETWRPLALPPENLRAILAATGGAVGHCADFNNYQGYGDPAKYDALRAVLPGAATVHAGGQFDGDGTLDRDDFRRCLALARESGFDGPYVLIFSGPGDEWAGLAALAAEVRAAG